MDRKWTVMIYLAGDTQDLLSAEMIFALREMKEVHDIGPDKPVTVLVIFDPCSGESRLERYVINKSSSLEGDLETVEEKATVKQSLADFVKWGITSYRAEHSMLILSGHGSGPEGNCLLPDQDPVTTLTLRDLHDVIYSIHGLLGEHPLDILGMSCCLANMAELCHELQPYPEETATGTYVDYLIGAEGYEPLTGWPYKEIFQAMAADNDSGTERIARNCIREYEAYYKGFEKANVSTYIAAIDLAIYPDVARSLSALSFVLSRALDQTPDLKEAVLHAHLRAQSYLYGKYVDLYDFCEPLNNIQGEIGDLCKDICRTIKRMVPASAKTGNRFEFSNGLGIYLPWTEVGPKYPELRFARDTRWHEFLKKDYQSRVRGSMVIGVMPEDLTQVRGGGNPKPNPSLVVIPG